VESEPPILKISEGGQTWTSFGDIKQGDSIAYFGLAGCGTDAGFYAFVLVIAGTDEENSLNGNDFCFDAFFF
jgi:hypothetical protein